MSHKRSAESNARHVLTNKIRYARKKEELDAWHKKYRDEHREEIRIRNKAWRIAHAEELKVYRKKYNDEHREEIKAWQQTYQEKRKILARIRRYGITDIEFNTLLEKQGGTCAVCKMIGWNGKGPHVDHNHKTGKVRGILCSNCNAAVGMMKDNRKIVQGLVEYMKTWTEE